MSSMRLHTLSKAVYPNRMRIPLLVPCHNELPMKWVWTRVASLARPLQRVFSSKPSPVVLRPYQEACLDACTQALDSGVSRIGVSLPTGSGKTTVFISLLSRIPKVDPDVRRSLVIVNSIELARQTANQVQTLFPNWSVEIEQGVKHKASGLADMYASYVSFSLTTDLISCVVCTEPLQRIRLFFNQTESQSSTHSI